MKKYVCNRKNLLEDIGKGSTIKKLWLNACSADNLFAGFSINKEFKKSKVDSSTL